MSEHSHSRARSAPCLTYPAGTQAVGRYQDAQRAESFPCSHSMGASASQCFSRVHCLEACIEPVLFAALGRVNALEAGYAAAWKSNMGKYYTGLLGISGAGWVGAGGSACGVCVGGERQGEV